MPLLKSVKKIIKLYLWIGAAGAVIGLSILLLLPSDQDTAWLLGYSKSRWVLIGSALMVFVLFAGVGVWLERAGGKNKLLDWLVKLPHDFFAWGSILLLGGLAVFAWVHTRFLNPNDIELFYLQQRIRPVFWLGVWILTSSLLVCLVLNAQINGRSWFETLFVRQRVGQVSTKFSAWVNRWVEKLAAMLSQKVLVVLVLLWPLVFNLGISWLAYGTTLTDFTIRNSDEVYYWQQAVTFMTAGFHGGQFGTDNGMAKAEFIHFGAHGPFFPILQGGLGRLIGWYNYTPALINLIFTGAALVVLLYVLKPDKVGLVVLWMMLAAFTPLYIFISMGMQQVLHISFGIILGALFVRWSRDDDRAGFPIAVWLVIVIFAASLFRYSWMLLYAPLILIGLMKLERKQIAALIGLIGLGVALSSAAANWLWAPYPLDIRFRIAAGFDESFFAGVGIILGNMFNNLINLLKWRSSTAMAIRAQMVVILIFSAIGGWRMLQKRKLLPLSSDEKLLLISGLNIVGIFLMDMMFYYARSTTRIWAPHVILSLILLMFIGKRREFWVVFVFGFIAFFQPAELLSRMIYSKEKITAVDHQAEEFRTQTDEFLAFDPDGNKWCNTVTISKYSMTDQMVNVDLAGLPPGFGFMVIVDWKLMDPDQLESKYLLADPAFLEAEVPELFDDLDLEYLTTTALGNLYLNRLSTCSP